MGGGIISILILCYFKYAEFFRQSFSAIFGEKSVEAEVLLPIGISFYVFSGLSYLIDIYWKRYEAEYNFLNFSLYIGMFSKLAAGPIVRAGEFLVQVRRYRGICLDKCAEGLQIFVFGLFKKIVLADHLSIFLVDVFFSPSAFDTATVILAAISYSFQIYFDFSGYSDMAIGISKILGFDFTPNFNLPYISKNVSEFWKRWHISLSSWFQEYLYIPLGGSRKGNIRTYLNLMIVMGISGFWHGSGWTFIIWGVLYGIVNCFYRFWSKKIVPEYTNHVFFTIGGQIMNFAMVTIFWVIFRADSIETAIKIWRGMFTLHTGISQMYSWTFFSGACLITASAAAVLRSKRKHEEIVNGYYVIMDLSKVSSLIIFFTFIGLTILMGYFGNNVFIYGKF